MDHFYHQICLRLILGISKALEQMEREEYDAAKKTLLDAWNEAAGSPPQKFML